MSLRDRLRLEWTVWRYDLMLDIAGVGGRQQREARRELRSNLREAASDTSFSDARDRVGSLWSLAQAHRDERRVMWKVGLYVSLAVLFLGLMLALFMAVAFLDGAMAANESVRTEGSLFGLPGSHVAYSPEDVGFSFQLSPGWLPFAAAGVVFVLTSRLWRLRPLQKGAGRDNKVAAL